MEMMIQIRDLRTEKRFFVDNAIIADYGAELKPIGIAVYCALCLHARLATQQCYPSQQTLAEELGTSLASVKRGLAKLTELQLIAVEHRYNENGGKTSNLYTLVNPPIAQTELSHSSDRAIPIAHRELSHSSQRAINNPKSNNPNLEQSEENGRESGGPDSQRKRRVSPEQRQRRAIQTAAREHFERVTGIRIPEKGRSSALGRLWWNPIREICGLADYDMEQVNKLISESVTRLQGLTVSDPNSILKTARAIAGEWKRGISRSPRGRDAIAAWLAQTQEI